MPSVSCDTPPKSSPFLLFMVSIPSFRAFVPLSACSRPLTKVSAELSMVSIPSLRAWLPSTNALEESVSVSIFSFKSSVLSTSAKSKSSRIPVVATVAVIASEKSFTSAVSSA